MSFNATNITNITSTIDLFQTANTVSYGYFGTSISLVIFGLLFVGTYRMSGNSQRALIASSFASFVINLLLVQIEMLNAFWASVPLIIFAASLFVTGK